MYDTHHRNDVIQRGVGFFELWLSLRVFSLVVRFPLYAFPSAINQQTSTRNFVSRAHSFRGPVGRFRELLPKRRASRVPFGTI